MKKIWAISLLLICASPRLRAQDTFWQDQTWETPDGIELKGLSHAARGKGWTWVLLHGLGSTMEEWDAFARDLAKRGDGAVLVDLRGHGQSVQTHGGQKLDYKEWRSAGPGTPWDAMLADAGTVVEATRQKARHVAVGGASLGANLALIYASRDPAVPAVIALSPGFVYAGIAADKAPQLLHERRVLIAASPGDSYAYSTVRQFDTQKGPAWRVIEGPGAAHGVQMLGGPVTEEILDWIQKTERNSRSEKPSSRRP
jgi:pimeloyl-ACP methyl ester carboxylesterase